MRPTDAEGRSTPGRPVLVRIAWPPPERRGGAVTSAGALVIERGIN
jgi:hypothetical protein